MRSSRTPSAFENFEIAAYKSLIVMSQAAGRQADKGALQRSLDEEQRMADWVRDNVEKVTTAYLQMAADGGAVGTQSTQASQLT